MKTFFALLRSAVLAVFLLALICGGLYPLLVLSVGQWLFPFQANGSLVTGAGGVPRGSRLIGQLFTGDRYFHPRPSCAGDGYDASRSGGSNLGPSSRPLAAAIAQRVRAYRLDNGLAPDAPVPADAVTASASGLDPDISVPNAVRQGGRVARARGLPPARVAALIGQHTTAPQWGVLGEARVNVLELNLALDNLP